MVWDGVTGLGWSNGFGMGAERAGDLFGCEMLTKHGGQHQHCEVGQEGRVPRAPHAVGAVPLTPPAPSC